MVATRGPLNKVAAQSEPEGGCLTPGLKVEVAETHTRGAKSELLLPSTQLRGKQCETQEFR